MKKIIIFADYFLPGYKAGGPIRSLENLSRVLKEDYSVYLITRDHDQGEVESYNSVKKNEWNKVNDIDIFYISSSNISFKNILKLVKEVKPDLIYLNSFFSKFSVYITIAKKLSLININILLAPRGEFSPGALKLKKIKKSLFIKASQFMKIYSNINWHVTNNYELGHLNKNFQGKAYIASNITENTLSFSLEENKEKRENEATFVFISRISKKKNLLKAIELLGKQDGNVRFDIYGPKEDETYWKECEEYIDKLPSNIICEYKGSLPHEKVKVTLKEYHFLLFPTHGENFGHIINESILSGTPLIISDQTPWINLEKKGVGWETNLSEEDNWNKIIGKSIKMNQKEYNEMLKSIHKLGQEIIENPNDIIENKKMFHDLLKNKGGEIE